MKERLQITLFALALFLGASLLVSAQVGLWVSTASGLTTSGKVAITSSASDALTVTGGQISATSNTNAAVIHAFTNTNAGNSTFIQHFFTNSDGSGTVGLGGSGHSAFPNTLVLINGINPGPVRIQSGGTAAIDYVSGSSGHNFGGGRINSNASQPGFLCLNSADHTGLSGTITARCDNEIYDNTGSFAGSTFTAPVTGNYHFCVQAVPGAGTFSTMDFVTSNRSYSMATGTLGVYSTCTYAEMDVSDTAFVQVTGASGLTMRGTAAGVNFHYFSGRLVP